MYYLFDLQKCYVVWYYFRTALNIVRIRTDFKLIDFDAAVNLHPAQESKQSAVGDSCGYVGLKYSSGYIPPEMIGQDADKAVVRSFHFEDDAIVPDCVSKRGDVMVMDNWLLKADKSFDIWSLGVVLYHLCTNETLFHCDGQDNIDLEGLMTLHNWTPEVKAKKLKKVHNELARNLISKLLNKQPEMRPVIPQILAHPFLSGKPYTRLSGEPPSYDVFISYRQAADSHHAEALYTHLTQDKGLRVFWDKKCLPSGVSWIEGKLCMLMASFAERLMLLAVAGFCDGLIKSRTFLPILSRAAIHNANSDRSNFTQLKHDSPCDNVLLEHRLALEFKQHGLVEFIFPVLIGDMDETTGTYSNYFADGSHPRMQGSPLVVESVELALHSLLETNACGTPLRPDLSVADTLSEILVNQGGFVEGQLQHAMEQIGSSIAHMLQQDAHVDLTASASAVALQSSSSSGGVKGLVAALEQRIASKDEEIICLRLQIELLKSKL